MPKKAAAKPTPKQPASKRWLAFCRRSRCAHFVLLWFVPFIVLESFLFSTFLNDYNYLEVFPRSFIFTTELEAVTALVIALAVYFIPRPRRLGAKLASSTLLSLLLVNYDTRLQNIAGVYRAVTPILPKDDLPFISLLFALTLLGIALAVGVAVQRLQHKHMQLHTGNIVAGTLIIVGVMFVGQASRVAHMYPQIWRESHTQPASLGQPNATAAKTAAPNGKPDIYYFVLDRYASDNTLENQFGYHNDFTDYLRDNSFAVKSDAYANYPYTAISVSSTINAQYTNKLVAPYKNSDIQSRTLYHNIIRQSSVVKALKSNGYQYYSIGSWYGATSRAPLANRDYMWDHLLTSFGHQKRLRGMEAVAFSQSLFYRLGKVSRLSWWPFKIEDRTQVDDVRQQLSILDSLSTSDRPGGRFIMAHILVPHDPFYFNADGSLSDSPGTDSTGRAIKQKYTDQVTFISDQMRTIVDNIQKGSDGKSVILFSSDEGPYPQMMNSTPLQPATTNAVSEDGVIKGDMRAWPEDWLQMKFGILQAVHIPAATEEDLQQLSSVNMFRIVLNRYLGYDLPYLPDCHYALSVGSQSEYNYGDITPKLSGNDDDPAACQQQESLPSATVKK